MEEAGVIKAFQAFIQFMVALKDGLNIKTLVGTMKNKLETLVESKPPKYYKEKLKNSAVEALRNNVFIYNKRQEGLFIKREKDFKGFN